MKRDLYDEDHEALRASFRAWLDKEVVPHERAWDADGDRAPGGVRRRRPARVPGLRRPRGVRRRRDEGLPVQRRHRRGAAGGRRWPAPGSGSPCTTTSACRTSSTYCTDEQKAALAAGHLLGRAHHRHRHDRAGHRLGPGVDVDHRHPRRRPLRRQRLEDVHHQRHQRRPRHHRGEDRPRPSATRACRLARARAGHGRASSGAATWRRSACTPRTPPSCSSPTSQVPVANLLGEEGQGFVQLVHNLPQERLSIAVSGVAAARAALGWTLEYVKERQAFGQPIGSFQNSRFVLAEIATEIEIAQTFVDRCIARAQRRRAHRRGGGHGQVVVHRAPEAGRRPLPAAARRLRLHARVPDRPGLRRRPHHHASTAAPPRS